ncbi:MFS transporter [Galbitalea sp. SE-J8]|uniref:MFS transporter n=1 Tax=Galbitalea sp. SE-J8 TaxID=3054952 RepID=UPI00259CDE71|nr:MFS transporter [Galbitalea sp. SE-J8]MDM4763297.1 MFS transporter [Galbitalea sp. SE-J8]
MAASVPPPPLAGRSRMLWVTIAIVLIGLVLRSPVVAVAPVVRGIQLDLGVGASVVALLTSIPVLCFAVATPFAVWLANRGGTPFAMTAGLAAIVVGAIVRSVGDVPAVFAGTALLGIGITVGNVIVPVVIRREYSGRRARLMTPLYTSTLNIGSAAATLGAPPIAAGAGWRVAIAVWAFAAVVAIAVLLGLNGWRRSLVPLPAALPELTEDHVPPRLFRSATTWMLAAAFAGQAFAYYSVTAWLPTLLADEVGTSTTASGAIAAVFQISAIAGAFLVPAVASRLGDAAGVTVIGAMWMTVPIGFLLAPGAWAVWCVVGGAAQGGGFTAITILVVVLARDDRHASRLSGLVQGVAYAVAALGPLVVGAVHEAVGGWVAPLLVVLAATSVYLVVGTLAGVRIGRRAR